MFRIHENPITTVSLKASLRTSLLVFFAGWLLFLANIGSPPGYSYDELHYVPAAKELISLKEYRRNLEHPPLGKFIIASGISLFGDNPLGWRFMSTVFGALTLVGMYFLSLGLLKNNRVALFATAITAVNHLLYVQARTGMLDTFMVAFLIWAVTFFCLSWTQKNTPQAKFSYLFLSGSLFGFSIACKWFAVIPLFYCTGILVYSVYSQNREKSADNSFSKIGQNNTLLDVLICLALVPAATYFLTFLPLLLIGHRFQFWLQDFWIMQLQIWKLQHLVLTPHPYMSHWAGWPLLLRPIWYFFERVDLTSDQVRGVLLLGNPLIMWTGIPAVFFCFWSWIKDKSVEGLFISGVYCALYFGWAIIPRKVFFYYYYYPAGMMLSLALGFTFLRLEKNRRTGPWPKYAFMGVAILVFVYFLPVLSGMPVSIHDLRKWAWFQSWI